MGEQSSASFPEFEKQAHQAFSGHMISEYVGTISDTPEQGPT